MRNKLKDIMELNRETFRIAIYEAIRAAEKREAALGYTGPSAYRAVLIELLAKTENEESIITLTD